jgi:hypothetical protein
MKAHLSVNEIGLGNPAASFGSRPSLLPSVAPIGVQLFERSHRGAADRRPRNSLELSGIGRGKAIIAATELPKPAWPS